MTVREQASARPDRDPQCAARLLRAERAALLPVLRAAPADAFDRPTACPGWSVRDVLAHCAAALTRAIEDQLHAFTPDLNEADVAQRRGWPLSRLLDELDRGYAGAATVIAESGGRLDGIALGEWVHGGDVRDALGEPLAFASDGFHDACVLLAARTRARSVPLVLATLPDVCLSLGAPQPSRPPAELRADQATLIRLFAGRPADPAAYQLSGATAAELIVF
jgi:uncharacterized protein (TIGR03083 family)